jgi:hypothetical protein
MPDTPQPETTLAYKFSASRLKLIDDCFGKYVYRYVQKIDVPQIVWPGTIRGTILHQILEESVKQKLEGVPDKAILEGVHGKFEKYFEIEKADKSRGVFTPDRNYRRDEFIHKGEKAAETFARFVINYFKDAANAFPELDLAFEYEFEKDTLLTGIIDLPIMTFANRLRIIDFKTTKESNKWYFVLFKEDLQSLVYFYLGWKHFKQFSEGFDYLIYNIEEKNIFFKSITFLEEPEDKQKFFQPLTRRIKLVKKLHDNPDTKYYHPSAERCKWCEFRKAKVCPVAVDS